MQKKRWIFALAIVIIAVAVGVALYFLVTTLVDKCKNLEAPNSLTIIKETEEILISWNEPEAHEDCNISYKLQYVIDQDEVEEIYITGTSHTLPLLNVCSSLYVYLWTTNEGEKESSNFVNQTYQEIPEKGEISGIEFLPTDAGLEVTWTKSTELETCDVYYNIEYSSDITDTERQYAETFFQNMTIPHDMYCFRVVFYISAYIYGQYVSGSVEVGIYSSDLEEPQELALASLTTENILVALWNEHDKQQQCDIEYKVSYEYGDSSSTFTIQEARINLDIAYCTEAIVQVRTVRNDIESNATTAVHSEEYPTSLGPVQNLKFDVTEWNEAVVSWNPPKFASQCTHLEYAVSARNEETEEVESCTGKVSCSLILSNVCPTTVFTVREVSGVTEEISVRHNCD